jgi:Flp pilus assembly protein TadD
MIPRPSPTAQFRLDGRKISHAQSIKENPLKKLLAIAAATALLSACAGPSRMSSGNDGAVVAAAVEDPTTSGNLTVRRIQLKAQAPATAPVKEGPPTSALTEDILFKFLSAEIADQRGQWQSAYINMLSIAQQTRDPRIARRAAEIALNAKQAGEALNAVRLWREVAPGSEEATQFFLSLVVLSDNLAEARPILQERLKNTSPHLRGTAVLQTQRLLARAKNKAAAFALLEEILTPYKPLLEVHLALAQGAAIQGNFERARQEAQAALIANPGSEQAALTLSQVTPDKKDALGALSTFLTAHPQSRDVRMAYARMLADQKQFKEALQEFKILLKQQPQNLTVLFALGYLSHQAGDPVEAETHLTAFLNVLATRPDDERDPTQTLLLLTQIAEERNDIPAALKWLERIDDGPAYIGAQVRRAQLLAKGGDLAAARKSLSEINAHGEDQRIQLAIAEAQILRNAEQPQNAFAVLEATLKRYPDNADLLYEYGLMAEKMNQLETMETALRKVIKLAPDNQHAYNALGYAFAERNIRLQEALALIEKAVQLAPNDPYIMDSMGWIQFRLGKLQEAEALLRKAYELRADPEIATHLGEVLWVKGQQEDAKKLWRDANTKDPKNDTLKSTLARLQVSL